MVRGSRNSKNHESMLDSSNFGGRRQRRQPVNAPRHGPAMPSTGVSDQSDVVHVMLTLCQEKKKERSAERSAAPFFFIQRLTFTP
jgi:hypothetical protein